MTSQEDLIARFLAIVDQVGPENVYRSVVDPEGRVLAAGTKPVRPGLVEDFLALAWAGRTVIDLGCNFGLFSFAAARAGARVTGVDYLPGVVEGCRVLAELHGLTHTRFVCDNIEAPARSHGRYDVALLLDYIGRSAVVKNKIPPLIEFLKTLSGTRLVVVIRPVYHVESELDDDPKRLEGLYGSAYVQHGFVDVERFVTDLVGPSWHPTMVSARTRYFEKEKKLIIFDKMAAGPFGRLSP